MKDKKFNRSVKDIWKAFKVSGYILVAFGIVGLFAIMLIEINFNIKVINNDQDIYFYAIIIGTIFATRTFFVYQKGISIEDNFFSWPASDVENSLLDILTLKRVRGFFYREKIPTSEIQYVTNDFGWKGIGGKKERVYGLNISGEFGSRTIRFNSKQKRDEARNMLKQFSKSKIEADIAFN